MKILNFEYIYFMLIPSLVLLYLIITNKSEIERIFEKDILNRLKINMGLEKNLKIFLLFFALFLMIFAISRPVIQKGVVEVTTKKGSLVIALDISKSMLAKDIYPNRLIFSKQKILNLLNEIKEAEIGVVAFAKEAFIVSPLTSDFDTLKFLLKNLDISYITLQGTNFLAALEVSNSLFEKKEDKNLLIITDGGDQKDFSKEIEFAKKNKIKIFVLGVGSQKGAPIEIDGGFLKDKNQNIVITKLNENIQYLAKESKGEFVRAKISNEDIEKIVSLLNFKKSQKKEKIVDQIELAPYFMGVALFLLSIVFFSIPSKSDFKKIFLISVLVFSTNSLKAFILDFKDIKKAKEYYEKKDYKKAINYFEKVAKSKKSAQSFYDLANAYYKAKKYKEAIKYYNLVQTPNKELERYKLHNLGNSYFMLKDYKKAIEFYEKALKIKYDPDTKYNLELAKKMLKKSQNKKSGNKKKKDQKEDKKGKQGKSGQQDSKKEKSKKGKKSKKSSKKTKSSKKIKNIPISDKEEKKWIKKIEKKAPKTVIYKIPLKHKGIKVEKPW